jgi:hypothetical protein
MQPVPEPSAARERLLAHPLYAQLGSLDDLRVFLEHHVFAVWDFMSLLKSLQRQLTCVQVPWTPRGDVRLRAMINEIVAVEESDPAAGGRSHFEWYLDAMSEAGADTGPVTRFLAALGAGQSLEQALEQAPPAARPFVRRTLAIALDAPVVVVAAEFTAGRERLIPDMFPRLVASLARHHPSGLPTLLAYLERHIEVDGGSHGPLAEEMVRALARDNDEGALAQRTALEALRARHQLWDGVVAALAGQEAARAMRGEAAAARA